MEQRPGQRSERQSFETEINDFSSSPNYYKLVSHRNANGDVNHVPTDPYSK